MLGLVRSPPEIRGVPAEEVLSPIREQIWIVGRAPAADDRIAREIHVDAASARFVDQLSVGFEGVLVRPGSGPIRLRRQRDAEQDGATGETGEESPVGHFLDAAAFCFAQRSFCAAEIFALAAADIFRRPRRPDPFGRPGPRFATFLLPAARPRRMTRSAPWPSCVSSFDASSRSCVSCFTIACR